MKTRLWGHFASLLIAPSLVAVVAVADTSAATSLTDSDKAFLDAIATSDVAEVELSRAALARLQTPAVNSLAQAITSDHNQNYQALVDLCRQKQYAVAPQLDAYHGEVLRKINAAPSAQAAEQIYIDAVTADQSALNGLLEQTAGNSNDTEVARFASDLLTMVKSHAATAEQLSASSRQ